MHEVSDNTYNKRINKYGHLSTQLALLSNKKLSDLLAKAPTVHSGIGGTAIEIELDEIKIFAKKIPLTDLELQPENFMSTANIFNLPLYFQYGVGSGGFSAWRDLAMHVMCSNWVLINECSSFPLMYHWRILSAPKPGKMSEIELNDFDKHIKYWNDSDTIRDRLGAKFYASSYIVIFLEYFSHNLYNWLGGQLKDSNNVADMAVSMVDNRLKEITTFLNSRGVMHFDAHFWNILTDGNDLYFSDFGLTLCSQFELSSAEIKFLSDHRNYDICSTVTNFVHRIITGIYGELDDEPGEHREEYFAKTLREYLDGRLNTLPPTIDQIIKRYGAIALVMDKFYRELRHVSKTTIYPATELRLLCDESGLF